MACWAGLGKLDSDLVDQGRRHCIDAGGVSTPPLATPPRKGAGSLLGEKGLASAPSSMEMERYEDGPYLKLAKGEALEGRVSTQYNPHF